MKSSHLKGDIVEVLYKVSSLVGEFDNPHEALNQILLVTRDYFGAFGASIALINPETRKLEIEVNQGLPETTNQFDLPLGLGVMGWVALHAKPLLVPDVREDNRYVQVSPDVFCEMACPMEDHGQIIGVIVMDSTIREGFDEHDLKALGLIAREASRVVSQLWLIRKLTTQATQLETLISMGQDLVSKMDLDDLLQSITHQAHVIMDCRMAMMLISDQQEGTLKVHSLAGNRYPYEPEPSIRMEESSFGAAMQLKRQIEVLDIRKSEEHHFWDIVNQEGLVSMLCSPIIWEDEVVGILVAYSERMHRFNNDEKRIFRTLASFSGVAIQNLRLYSMIFENEENLRSNDKLITLGLLAAEIAHEIRNPLTVIKLLFGSLGLEFDEADERNKDMRVIQEKLAQLEEIVERVLNFGKSSTTMHSQLVLQDVLDETIRLVRLKLKQNRIETDSDYHAQDIIIDANKGQIQQVVLNLILNATQAMGSDGSITLRCYPETILGQNCACIDIIDTGPGIKEEIRTRIFDSFLTGREGGTGLGLSIVKRIMRSHRGNIEVTDTSSHGTTIKVWLPRVS